jgi:DNA-binding transcriptional MerR regulator
MSRGPWKQQAPAQAAIAAAKVTYRRLDYWSSKGWLQPEGGVGHARRWSDEELAVAERMGRYVDMGVSPPVAAHAARNDGLTPSGGRLLLPEEVSVG